MIQLRLLPCNNCKHYEGIKSIGEIEKENQYVKCNKASQKNAENLINISEGKISCTEYEDIDNG